MPVDPDRMGSFRLGAYQPRVDARLAQWSQQEIGRRIWEKDSTVWSETRLPEIADRLGWLDLPETMNAEVAGLRAFADEIKAEGIRHVVLLGMGGSSLAPQVYQATFGNQPEYPELITVDSTHPGQVKSVESRIDLRETLFIVASKSGSTLESLALFKYFYKLVAEVSAEPGHRFVATTDPRTSLVSLARKHRFRRIFLAPPDVGGRYSALCHFGLVPAAIIGMDLGRHLSPARSMALSCGPAAPEYDNPGLVLGAALGELALAGRDKVTFVTSPWLGAFPLWLEQLIAESTGKDGKGIIPIVDESLGNPDSYGSDRFFIYQSTRDESDQETKDLLQDLEDAGHPVARFKLPERPGLAGEMFRWELGVAAAGKVLSIQPFNQPDVQLAKDLARKAMATEAETGDTGDTIPAGSSERLLKGLRSLFSRAKPGDYIGIHAYLATSSAIRDRLEAIRMSLARRCGLATTLGFGPQLLHSTGQLHKGGPNTGIFIQLVDSPAEEIPVPGTDYSFARLIRAQARGDYQALLERDRRILRVELGEDPLRGLAEFEVALQRLP